jgi:hypothetical protein
MRRFVSGNRFELPACVLQNLNLIIGHSLGTLPSRCVNRIYEIRVFFYS